MPRPGSAERFVPSSSLKYLGERVVVNVNFDSSTKVARVETMQTSSDSRNEFSYDHSELLKLLDEGEDSDLIASLQGEIAEPLAVSERDRLVAKLLKQVPIRLAGTTAKVISQAEVVSRFVPGLKESNAVWKKTIGVNAKTYAEAEPLVIETVTGGGTETSNTAKKGDIIAINPGGERYVMAASVFQLRYFVDEPSEPRSTQRDSDTNALKEDGFAFYEPRGKVFRREVTAEDISTSFPQNKLTAAWGEQMQIEVGDSLCAPYPDATEVYRIAAAEFEATYAPVD